MVHGAHEAGHAVVGSWLGFPPNWCELGDAQIDKATSHGRTSFDEVQSDDYFRSGLESMKPLILRTLAGAIADCIARGADTFDYNNLARWDWELCERGVSEATGAGLVTDDGSYQFNPHYPVIAQILTQMAAETQLLVKRHWPEIKAVARKLLERGKLSGAEVVAIANAAQKGGT
jgi:hypothetical protein